MPRPSSPLSRSRSDGDAVALPAALPGSGLVKFDDSDLVAVHDVAGAPPKAPAPPAGGGALCNLCEVHASSPDLGNGMCVECNDYSALEPGMIEVGSRLLSQSRLDPQVALYWATLMITRASYERTANRLGICVHCDKFKRLPSSRSNTCAACAIVVRRAL